MNLRATILTLTLLLPLIVPATAWGRTAEQAAPGGTASAAAARLLSLPEPDCDRLRDEPLACLACNIYHEARSEGADGMKLVGKVTMNRVGSDDFPDDVCAVVWQRLGDGPAQFSWTRDGRSHRVLNRSAWRRAVEVAALMFRDHYDPDFAVLIAGALRGPDFMWFHNGTVRPSWTRNLEKVAQIGRHTVYRRRGR
ncbi:cell wall hydrolase [Marinibaculum pumilum]|uniref:Cell wall hydrolase n=1 Tax=Marinibaculum pumilum TaxID=1766165 RepID=A0ABV7KVF9_9PROT